jgi:ABC-2 type transport system permease protein
MKGWLTWRAGSVMWLLAHEWRLFFYEMGQSRAGGTARRGASFKRIAIFAIVLVAMHAGAWFVLFHLPAPSGELPASFIMGTGLVLMLVSSMMLSLALNRSVSALFVRGDMDLLLSSPLPAQTVFSVRLAVIVFGVAAIFMVVLSPFAHVGLVLGQVRWLAIYPTILSMALIASSLGIALTLALVRLLGVRRTLVAAQLLGALTGAGFFLLTQLFGNLGERFRTGLDTLVLSLIGQGGLFNEKSLFWLPARGLLGSPWELLVFAATGVGCFWLTVRFTRHFFVRVVQQAGTVTLRKTASMPGVGKKTATGKAAFTAGAARNIVLKEWRLILRDPQLISQVGLQLLYMLPLFFIVFKESVILPGVGAGMTFLAASLTGSLIWIIISAEDAPDLLAASPVEPRTVRHAKLFAAMFPVFLLILPVLGYILLRDPRTAVLTLMAAVAAMASVSLIHFWHAGTGSRNAFNKRGQTRILAGALEFASGFSWSATVFITLQFGVWGGVPFGLALLVLLLSYALRVNR